jgi:hypothetical protein
MQRFYRGWRERSTYCVSLMATSALRILSAGARVARSAMPIAFDLC